MIRSSAVLFALALVGCMSTPTTAPEPQRPPVGECNAGAVQSYVGRKATGDAGEAILAQSGARSLRWGPPRSAWTMDYREDRVNVRYDDDMVITDVTCG